MGKRASVGGEGAKKRNLQDKTVVAENFAGATCVALFLLARWAFTLPKAGVAREKAREVLNTLCAKPFASCAAVWHADWRAAGPATPLSAPSPTAVPVGIQKGQCRLRPLVGWFPGLLKVAQQEVPGAPGDLATLSLASLLCALVAENTTAALRAAASLACWMAACLEHSEWYASQSTDALQIPVLQGPSRRRHLDSAFKTQVAREAAQGRMGTSGVKIVRALRCFQNCGYSVADRPKDANSWNELVLAAYHNNAVTHYRGTRVQFVSLATDGTRLGGRETVLTAFCAPETQLCYWCPPRVGRLGAGKRRTSAAENGHFRNRKRPIKETGKPKTGERKPENENRRTKTGERKPEN